VLKHLKKYELVQLLLLMKKKLGPYVVSMILKNALTSLCFNIVIAFIMKDVFDAVTTGKAFLIKKAIILAAGSFIIGTILQPILTYINQKCIKETMKDLRTSAFKATINLPIENIEEEHSGSFISIVTNDMNNIEAFYSTQMNLLVFSLIFGILAITSIFFLEWRLAIVVILIGVITIVINNLFVPKIRFLNDKIQGQLKNKTSRLIDLLDSTSITKMFQAEKKVHNLFEIENNKYFDTSMKLSKVEATFDSINVFLSNLKYLGVLCLSLFMLFKGYILVGTVVAVMHLMGNANYMFDNIGVFIKDIQKSLVCGHNVLELLNMEPESTSYDAYKNYNGILPENNDSTVDFKDVTFNYLSTKSDMNSPTIKCINMCIKKNKITAIVGSSGSGKSTIAKLLLGFYTIKTGEINIDGNSISNYTMPHLRDKISYIPQNAYLFYGTIEENIAYGKPGVSKDSIIIAAKIARAHDFIMSLPLGYSTPVGENGESLSGGQKQRIAIARALLKDAPILLLDEATSSLDSETERQILTALQTTMKNKTIIIISHRLSTITSADTIYVFNKGKITEYGSHKELIAQNGHYQKLCQMQYS
jgi:ATP-binding cassette subfamily B protein